MINLKSIFLITCIAVSVSVKAQEQANIADPRLDFTLPDKNGDSVRLSSMKGKVFLLDFWASWCMPCRMSNKHLVKLYSKYKAKGFEIVGVSIDEKKKEWLRAVGKDKITWMQVNDVTDAALSAAVKWQVSMIPTSFLIDKNGNVVAIDPDKQELEKKLRELLTL
jgi:peroxiredoxin